MRVVFLLLFLTTNLSAAVLSSDQLSCTITEDGIQSISFAGKIVTTHPSPGFPTHQGFYASGARPPAPGTAAFGPVLHSTLAATSSAVTITDLCSNMTVHYTYSLSGDDIDLHAILKNNDSKPFSNILIALPTFALGPKVTGNMKSWDPSYLNAAPQSAFHPGTCSPLAVSYAQTENYALALHCKSHFDKPSLFNALLPSSATPPSVADLTLYLDDFVPPGNQLAVDITIHLTEKTDLSSVLSSYIRDFQTFAGPLQYLPDDRPWLQFSSFGPNLVKPDNPLGYNGDTHRFDRPAGIIQFEDMVWPSIGVTQGTIFWQPQGSNPRGCQYRPDFDVWPDSVSANLPKLIAWYKSNHLKFGLCARPADIVSPAGPDTDRTDRLDPQNPSQMAALIARFDNVAKLGVNAYYLDSFGDDLNSYHIMKQLRPHLGNAVPTYSEYTSDLMLPFCGVYTELTAPAGASPDGTTQWYDKNTLAIFRLLYPHSGIILTKITGPSSRPLVSTTDLADWKLTPLIQDGLARQYRSYFQDLISNHLTANVWK